MIVCTNCGNHNEDSDEFCGSCGKFLEWVGEKVAAPAAPAPVVEEVEADATKTGFVDRVKAAVGIDEASRHDAPVGVGVGGSGLPDAPEQDEAAAALEAAAAEAEAAERARQESEAAEAARRAAVAQQEAEARAVEQAESARRAEEEARVRAEAEAKANLEAEARRTAQLEAEAKARADAEARRAADEEAAKQAEQARLAQIEAERESATAAERAAAEAEAARQAEQAREAQAAADAAKRAEEAAKAAAEAEAAARAEAEARARAEAEARKAAEEEARLRAEDEARARAAAESRAREEEEARKRAAALLARPKAPAAPVVEATPTVDPFVTPSAEPATAGASHAQKPTAQQPVAQQPSAVKQPPRPDPKITAAATVISAGDLVCSQCGQGNDPARKFCRKCGNSLAAAVVAKKVPWWKKLFGGKKARTSKEAADRQRKKAKAKDASFKAQMLVVNARKVLMFLALFGLAGGLAIPSMRVEVMRFAKGGMGSVQDLFNPKVSPVNAVTVAASSAVPGREANFAADLVLNSYWAEGAEGDGVGQTISFTFAEPTDLTKVLITAGSTENPEGYLQNPRPKALHFVFDTGGSTDITLIDAEFRKSQGFNLKGAKGVTKVDVSISSVFPGRGGTETGIAEVEFKKKG